MEVVYDTGSDWLTIEGHNCKNCGGNTYNTAQSTTFKLLELEQSVELAYGSADLHGLRAQDQVCIENADKYDSSSICLGEFEFFLVSEQTGLDDRYDGVLGMCRSKVPIEVTGEDWRGLGPTLVKHLADAEVIQEEIFAFYLTSYADE